MEWRDEGFVIGTRKLGETSVILELMTRDHGRHLGVVRGGRSRRLQPLLQAGNSIEAVWRARLDDQLGTYVVEETRLRAAGLIVEAAALDGLSWMGALLRLLPERDPHPALFETVVTIADHLTHSGIAAALMVRLEVGMLAELGFGLDLATCAATGTREDLIFVSPKSGRAVSREAGAPYRDRLFALPTFLNGAQAAAPAAADIEAGFRLTEHFLVRDVFVPRGLALPDARARFLARSLRQPFRD